MRPCHPRTLVDLSYPLLAGASVVVATEGARRFGGRVGGVLAAAPVTPTFSVLALGASPALLLDGLPMVAITAVAAAFLLVQRSSSWALMPLGLGGPIGWSALLVTAAWSATAIPGAPTKRGRGLPWWVRFFVGAGTVWSVTLVAGLWPSLAGLVAMAPWLFVASLAASAWDGGMSCLRSVLQGGMAGAVGVGAFAWAASATASGPVWVALAIGWIAFAVTAIAWPTPRRRSRSALPSPA